MDCLHFNGFMNMTHVPEGHAGEYAGDATERQSWNATEAIHISVSVAGHGREKATLDAVPTRMKYWYLQRRTTSWLTRVSVHIGLRTQSSSKTYIAMRYMQLISCNSTQRNRLL